jgi:hypothetical protein
MIFGTLPPTCIAASLTPDENENRMSAIRCGANLTPMGMCPLCGYIADSGRKIRRIAIFGNLPRVQSRPSGRRRIAFQYFRCADYLTGRNIGTVNLTALRLAKPGRSGSCPG